MSSRYLIKSAGRTGSHIICEFLERHGYDHCHIHFEGEFLNEQSEKNFKKSKKLFVFCHSKDWIPEDPSDWSFVYSSRKNKFDQYCSFMIAHQTQQWTLYDKIKNFEKIQIDEKNARHHIINSLQWDNDVRMQIKNFDWKFSTEVVYEDIVNNHNHLFEILSVEGNYNYEIKSAWEKSPYAFDTAIKNYDCLNKKLKELNLW